MTAGKSARFVSVPGDSGHPQKLAGQVSYPGPVFPPSVSRPLNQNSGHCACQTAGGIQQHVPDLSGSARHKGLVPFIAAGIQKAQQD